MSMLDESEAKMCLLLDFLYLESESQVRLAIIQLPILNSRIATNCAIAYALAVRAKEPWLTQSQGKWTHSIL